MDDSVNADLDEFLNVTPLEIAERREFDAGLRTKGLSLLQRLKGEWEDVGTIQGTRGVIQMSSHRELTFTRIESLRIRRQMFPLHWVGLLPAVMFGLYYLGAFRSFRPDEPSFWIVMVGLLGGVIYQWWRTRIFEFEYTDSDGELQWVLLMPFDYTREKYHPDGDRLFKDLYATVMGREPSDSELCL